MKFTVVVPTMWKFPPFLKFLEDLVKREEVGEIIIVNNAFNDTPYAEILHNPKIAVHNFADNIGVNPAWNYGAYHAKFDKLCILSDDVIFDLKVFDKLTTFLTPGTFVCAGPERLESTTQIQGLIDFVHYVPGVDNWHYGCLMFINKQDWLHIPDQLKIYYGDTWLWETMLLRYNRNYVIRDMFFFTPQSVTCDFLPNRENISLYEASLFRGLIDDYRRQHKYS